VVTTKYAPHRRKLLALRARLQGVMTQMTDSALMEAKTTRMPNHMAELGSGNFDQELTFSLLGSERNALDQVEAAMARIADGSYGRCETCGGNIPKSRLAAIPYAAQCVRCASKQEDMGGTLDLQPRRRVLPR
jgi:RNA polymerase-binding transcription factor DksA